MAGHAGRQVSQILPPFGLFAAAAFLFAALPLWAAKEAHHAPQPLYRVAVAQYGYMPQNSSDLIGRSSTNSLDFIDQGHILLTFRVAGLMKRLPDEPPDDDDQHIHAMVLEVPSGKVTATADWRMHDRGRYLWPLEDGTFLVRQRDDLFLTDAALTLRPFIAMPTRLQSVQPSPDGKLLLLQVDQERHTSEEHQRLVRQALEAGASPPREDVQLLILRRATGEVIARSRSLRPVNMPIMADGFFDSLPGKADHWVLRFNPFQGQPRVLGEVASTCQPWEVAATASLSLLITCNNKTHDHLVQGVRADGKILWEFWWETDLIWPHFTGSADGARFAFSALRCDHEVNALDPVDPESLKGQVVQVFDVASGSPLLTVASNPATASSQNFALSPDGTKFALLKDGTIEVYDVPAPAAGKPAKPAADSVKK